MRSIHETKKAFNQSEKDEGGDDMKNKQLAFDILDTTGQTIIEVEPKEHNDILDGIGIELGLNLRRFWEDPQITTDTLKATVIDLPPIEQRHFIEDLAEHYYKQNAEYAEFDQVTIWERPQELLDLLKSITIADFNACRIENAEQRFSVLQKQIADAEDELGGLPADERLDYSRAWPILSMRYLFTISEMCALYYAKNPRISSKEKAKQAGAIMTTGGRLAELSRKDFRGWLDEVPNPTAYLSYVGPHYWDNIEIDEGGNIYEGDEAKVLRAVREQDKKIEQDFKAGTFGKDRQKEHVRINKELMMALEKATIAANGGTITIYAPTFAAELNKNYKVDIDEYEKDGSLNEKGRQNKEAAEDREREAEKARKEGKKDYTNERPSIMQQIYSLDYWVGVLNTNEVTRTAVIAGFNQEAQTIDIFLPYISKSLQAEEEAQRLEAETHRRTYLIPAYNFLVHTNIESERNKLAVDLVYTIIDGLLQRGSKAASDFKENQSDNTTNKVSKGEKVTYRATYRFLMENTPLFANAYKAASNTDQRYQLIKRVFGKAFKILHTKTDIYDYFIDLDIPEITPSIRTLDNKIVITHRGRNPNYKAK